MLSRRYSKIKDLENQGGGFIRSRKLWSSPFGEVYTGTAYFGLGESAKVKALISPFGGARIIGQAESSEECRQSYSKLKKYFADMEKSASYRKLLLARMVLHYVFFIAELYIIGRFARDIATIRPIFGLFNTAYIIMEVVLFQLIRRTKIIVESIF